MKEVRWVLQAAKPGTDDWKNHEDRVYSGWFYGGVNDEPSESVEQAYQEAVKELHWLDVRLIQETRTYDSRVLKGIRREVTNVNSG